MKKDIILAGVGGQGILSIAAVIGTAALEAGLNLKQAEVHGMSQRGGAVQSHLRISDSEISSDLIPEGKCDVILSVEPMESLRYLPFLSSEGCIITSSKPVVNIEAYPEKDVLLDTIRSSSQSVIIDADRIAGETGSRKASNIVMLGAAADYLGIPVEGIESALRKIFKRKGEEVVELNIRALHAGRSAGRDSGNN